METTPSQKLKPTSGYKNSPKHSISQSTSVLGLPSISQGLLETKKQSPWRQPPAWKFITPASRKEAPLFSLPSMPSWTPSLIPWLRSSRRKNRIWWISDIIKCILEFSLSPNFLQKMLDMRFDICDSSNIKHILDERVHLFPQTVGQSS